MIRVRFAVLGLLACQAAAQAQDLAIGRLVHYTENRGWNEAGLGPVWQIVVNATVTPSGFPTLVFVEQNGVREPMTQFPQDLYAHWKRFDPAFTGAWRVVAERSDAKGAAAFAPALVRPRQIPLAINVRVSGKGTAPRITWKLPGGLDIERIRVGVLGGEKIQGRFLSLLQLSDPLPPTATTYRVPQGWLKPGERYVFQVMLEDLEDGRLENRSLGFADPYTVR